MGVCCKGARFIKTPEVGLQIMESDLKSITRLDAITKHYDFIKLLGHGNFGVVRMARKNESKAEYAVKSVTKEK